MDTHEHRFDDETWANLPELLGKLPEPISLHIWGDPQASEAEREAIELAKLLADRFVDIEYRLFPRRISFSYYPVIGIMRIEEEEFIDNGLRIIGLPLGYQMTSLISAMQCVAFLGMTSEAKTRIQLKKLKQDVSLELITSADDEAGTVMAHRIFNIAVVSPFVKSYLIMGDAFPDVVTRYSVSLVPHLVINEKAHLSGVATEETILSQIAGQLKQNKS
jgi:alkyl hydroperoxide reductase subunit AhpF